MRTPQPKVKPLCPSKGNSEYVRLLESHLRATQKELSRERSSTNKYSQCLREQLDRALAERDSFKRELARATDQLISHTGGFPISDESTVQAHAPAEIVDALHASVFGEDEGNSMFPRNPIADETDEAIQ